MAPFEVVRLTNADPGFYALIGPFLARREIVRETGGHLWDDDGKQWWAALDGGTVAGVAAVLPHRKAARFCSAYVVPACRRRGVHRLLTAARVEAFPGPAEAVCTAASVPALAHAGFTAAGTRGRFTVMRKG